MNATSNGVTEIIDTAEIVEISAEPQMQVQERLILEPPLFDMDLERMNSELYRDRYLTPDDLLDDLRKIVHNASVRSNEDPERLFRAQAMLTAAEVSVQDFDPQFRLECQRMAGRERRRREEFRKNKEKERAEQERQQAAQNGTYAPGTRRSLRNNGQEPETSITDPLLLERRLKRQRSNGAETTPSEDENGERISKKVRTEGEGEGNAESQGGQAPSTSTEQLLSPTTGGRSMSVRFADEVPQPASALSPPKLDAIPESQQDKEAEPPRRGGFDPSLLNPMSPTDTRHGVPTDPPDNPFTPASTAPIPHSPREQHNNSEGLPSNAQIILDGDHPMENVQSTEPAEPSQADQPMEVERTPTPPLPDFHLDEAALEGLGNYLRDMTGSLTVEQLEQLRATCLGLVWKHRQEWDRANLLRELRQEAQTFVEEVAMDDMDAGSP